MGSDGRSSEKRPLDDLADVVLLDPSVDNVLNVAQLTVILSTPTLDIQLLVELGGLADGNLNMSGSSLEPRLEFDQHSSLLIIIWTKLDVVHRATYSTTALEACDPITCWMSRKF